MNICTWDNKYLNFNNQHFYKQSVRSLSWIFIERISLFIPSFSLCFFSFTTFLSLHVFFPFHLALISSLIFSRNLSPLFLIAIYIFSFWLKDSRINRSNFIILNLTVKLPSCGRQWVQDRNRNRNIRRIFVQTISLFRSLVS